MRKKERIRILDTEFRMLNPQTCFEAVVADQTNTILLMPGSEIDTANRPGESDTAATLPMSAPAREAFPRKEESSKRVKS